MNIEVDKRTLQNIFLLEGEALSPTSQKRFRGAPAEERRGGISRPLIKRRLPPTTIVKRGIVVPAP